MPATRRGSAYRLGPNRWGIRYRVDGKLQRKSLFQSKSAALAHHREVIEPQMLGIPQATPDVTLATFIEIYLSRHAAAVRPRTISTPRDRLQHAIRAFGDIPLHELERMADEIAGWQSNLPPRAGHGITQALRQVLDAAVRWERIGKNPAKLAARNPKPSPRAVRAFSRAELDAIALELPAIYASLPMSPLPRDYGPRNGRRSKEKTWTVAAS